MNISYSKLSNDYEKVRLSHNYIVEILNSDLPLRQEDVHVDLGCGTCKETNEISLKIKSFIGVDLSNEMLSIAKGKIKNGLFIQHDLQNNIPLNDNSANSVSIISFYHHIKNKKKFFSELLRIVKTSGSVVIITNSIQQLEMRGYYKYFPHAIDINKKRFLEINQLEKLLNDIGFTIIKSNPILRPYNYFGSELLQRINSPAFDSVFNLISKKDFENGLKQIQTFFDSGEKLKSCRDRYLIVCKKY